MCSLVEILCVFEEEIGLQQDVHAIETFLIQHTCEIS